GGSEGRRAEDRLVLERAAIVGRQFSRAAVAHLLPREAQGELDARVEALRRSDLIEPDAGWFLGEPALRFHHGLIRDAAYRRVLKGTRAELHGRGADVIGGRGGGAGRARRDDRLAPGAGAPPPGRAGAARRPRAGAGRAGGTLSGGGGPARIGARRPAGGGRPARARARAARRGRSRARRPGARLVRGAARRWRRRSRRAGDRRARSVHRRFGAPARVAYMLRLRALRAYRPADATEH